jgi:flagellar biogenesis protein FliO
MILAASTAELTIRMLVSLGLMGLVALGALRLFRGRLRPGPSRAGITVEARHQLSRTSSVAVIRAGRRYLLVGVSEQAVSLLAEGGDLVDSAVDSAVDRAVDGAVDSGPEAADGVAEPAPGARVRHRSADRAATGGAGRRHGRATGAASSGMSVIEALRERTVRRS